jgi:small-conductance mechanosensitive channel
MESLIKHWLSDPTVRKILISLVIILVIGGFVRFFKGYLSRYISDLGNRYRARKFVSFMGYATGIIVLVTVFSARLGGLSVAFGVAGAGIAFALQEVIASVAGWLAVAVGNFYKTGDRIQLGGIMGDVIDIGVLRTTLMECRQWVNGDLYNGRIVRVANSFVFKEPVFNYSGDFHFLWDEIVVPVKYGCDYKLARELFQRIAGEITGDYIQPARDAWKEMVNKYLIEDARVDPMIFLIANDNWMEFTIRYVVDFKKRRVTKDLLFTRILEEIDKTEGRIAIASTTVHIVETPQFNVRLMGGAGDSVDRQ